MFSKTSVAVAAGMVLAAAILAVPGVATPVTGRAATWGRNYFGQLGDNSTTDRLVPVAVDTSGVLAGRTITAISAGYHHTCVVTDGKVYCWGYNNYGQLGDSSTTDRWVPVAVDTSGVLAGKTVTVISAGGFHTCAVAAGKASCWGQNYFGQLGDNTGIPQLAPVAVDTSGVLAGKTVTAVSAGALHSAVLAAATAPQPATAVTGTPADRQVTVSWKPPADDGGSPVLDYAATAVPGGATCTTTGTSCVVSGLINGTPYTFTVTARNAVGVSAPSAPSAAVTPQAPSTPPPPTQPPPQAPAKVTGVKATVSKGAVKITWKPVPGATSYKARISKPGGTKYKAWTNTSKRVFKATVRKGKKYRFQVAAVGDGGRGPTTTIRFKGK